MRVAEYPLPLALAYVLAAGYVARTLFISVHLPGAVGVIVVGYALSHFMQEELLEARDTLQELSFFLVLLTAGFEISLQDVRPHVMLLATLPILLEMSGIAFVACWTLGLTPIEGYVLGAVLAGLGDGLVIPKMLELGTEFSSNALPRMVFTFAPLEVSVALTTFGILRGLSDVRDAAPASVVATVAANVLNLVLTIAVGSAIGVTSGWLLARRTLIVVRGRQLFTGTALEAFVLMLAVALAAFCMGMNSHDQIPFIPIGFAPGSAFSSELMVIVTGAAFAATVEMNVLHGIEQVLGGVWVVGQLVLFSMLGSKTLVAPFTQLPSVLPLMLAGLACRAIGTLASVAATLSARTCQPGCAECVRANRRAFYADAAFCFVATLPRATLQGALAGIPLRDGFFAHSEDGNRAALLVSDAGRIYIVLMAICGSICLDLAGPALLRASTHLAQRHISGRERERETAMLGWTARRRTLAKSIANSTPRLESSASVVDDDDDDKPIMPLPLHQFQRAVISRRHSIHVTGDPAAYARYVDRCSDETAATASGRVRAASSAS